MEERLSFWERFKDHVFNRERPPNFRDRTTAWVTGAVIILLTFVVWVVSSGAQGPVGTVIETIVDGNVTTRTTKGPIVNSDYVDLLSDIGLIIAASFTTVIGYYFGNRNAETQAKEMTAAVEENLKKVTEEKAEITGQLEGLRNRFGTDSQQLSAPASLQQKDT